MQEKMTHVIPVYKYVGETPLKVIERIKKAYPYYIDLPMTYAGRLDPMADGMLLLLAGEECKQKDDYLVFSKTYIIDVVFGVETDTYDVLGIVQKVKTVENIPQEISHILQGFIGKQVQKYPIFSSKTVAGKPLFAYAKEGKIDEIDIPKHEIEIFSIDMQDISSISFEVLKNKAIEQVSALEGDFRQGEIIKSWQDVTLGDMPVIRLKITAGSGTYMRQLAYDIGEKMGFPAIASRIYREKVGDFKLNL